MNLSAADSLSDERAPTPSSGVADRLGRVGASSPCHFSNDLRSAQGIALGTALGLAFWLAAFGLWSWLG